MLYVRTTSVGRSCLQLNTGTLLASVITCCKITGEPGPTTPHPEPKLSLRCANAPRLRKVASPRSIQGICKTLSGPWYTPVSSSSRITPSGEGDLIRRKKKDFQCMRNRELACLPEPLRNSSLNCCTDRDAETGRLHGSSPRQNQYSIS